MWSILERFEPSQFIGLTAVTLGCMIPIVGIIAQTWQNYRTAELATELATELVRRGLASHEIEVVMKAAGHKPYAGRKCQIKSAIHHA